MGVEYALTFVSQINIAQNIEGLNGYYVTFITFPQKVIYCLLWIICTFFQENNDIKFYGWLLSPVLRGLPTHLGLKLSNALLN